jgi:hypothetical protein
MHMTTFTNRSNAKRAAIKAGIAADQIEVTVHKEKGKARFGFKQKDAAPVVTTPAPAVRVLNAEPAPKREERNGVKRPAPGGACAAVWEWLDAHRDATSADVKAQAEKVGWNLNNASIEFYGWKRFNGLTKPRVAKPKKAKAARPAASKDEGQSRTA